MPTDPLDPRTHPYRADLAAEALRGRVEADAYVTGRPAQVARGTLPLRRRPDPAAPLDSQLLFGEVVTVLETKDGWAWVQNHQDAYVGYTPADGLDDNIKDTTHRVVSLRTFIFPEPDIKCPPRHVLSMTAGLSVAAVEGRFARLNGDGGWVFAKHVDGASEVEADYVATASQFLGIPYLWGGKDSLGLDCSGLVQLALHRAGHDCLRDSDQQQEGLPDSFAALPVDTPPERGDLIYFPGHVAIALDRDRVLHANAFALAVTIEPLMDVVARVQAESGGRGIAGLHRPRFSLSE